MAEITQADRDREDEAFQSQSRNAQRNICRTAYRQAFASHREAAIAKDEATVERVAAAMIEPLGYSANIDWEDIFVGNEVDAIEGTGSLRHLCVAIARAAIRALANPKEIG